MGENDRPPAIFYSAEVAGADRLVQCRPTSSSLFAGFGNRESKCRVHLICALRYEFSRVQTSARERTRLNFKLDRRLRPEKVEACTSDEKTLAT